MAKEKEQRQPMPPLATWFPAVVLGWLIPGGGHFLLKRNGRGALLTEFFIERRSVLERVSGLQAQLGDLADIHGAPYAVARILRQLLRSAAPRAARPLLGD